ncbi:MAG: 50S ribosomal protein L11 methyltransferase [Candidatus Hodarchaeales archaeon]|jgi:hypothetical protein
MKSISLPTEWLHVISKPQQGVFSYIAYNDNVRDFLGKMYGRDNLCLKIFKHAMEECYWQDRLLTDCTIVQNLFAFEGLAPRVFDIILVNGQCTQVTEYVTGDGKWNPDAAAELRRRYGLKTSWDMNPKNWVAGKLVDFQSWHFRDKKVYRQSLIDRAFQVAAWGSRPEPYQTIEDAPSQRTTSQRLKIMQWNKYDFAGKDVLDIGCNLGVLCHQAIMSGARRVIGVDLEQVAILAQEYANYHRLWNIDFIGAHLPREREKIEGKFDVVIALSVARQIGYDTWIADLCKEVMFFEGHVPDREETYRERLEQDFRQVDFLGMSRDHGPRPVFRCWK